MQDEIAAFVTDLLAGNVPHSVADEARRQLRIADEFESISDYETAKEERAFMRAVVAGLADLESRQEISLDDARARLGLK